MSVLVTVCRDCCCGTVRKHPTVDHGRQLARLRDIAARHGGAIRVSECLDTCETSNVVVVQAKGTKPIWLGFVLDDAVLDDIDTWLTNGGPATDLPATLTLNRVSPPRGK
ncbi:(2Fe-2S) ferredoxin domain-containing protein [Actinokineospora diospyrosa]|uniref:(2Fe-2S) ferredoxin n=1 Tax=Actinokineospora diospyrosa TaxID=103728 RepID=A0ABT1IAX7_9PSEU|nr:(2Fe-2S) ferredoxin domain-containing protein [Actinokineospora diospyrosa]MCP2269790.1 hypothetical protein [Actinokineospora diospyrosa]